MNEPHIRHNDLRSIGFSYYHKVHLRCIQLAIQRIILRFLAAVHYSLLILPKTSASVFRLPGDGASFSVALPTEGIRGAGHVCPTARTEQTVY